MLGKIEGKRRREAIEDEMVGWHHQLNGHEFEQTLGDSEGQGKPGILQSMELQRVGHNLVTEQQQSWLRLNVSNTRNVSSVSGWGTKIPHATRPQK